MHDQLSHPPEDVRRLLKLADTTSTASRSLRAKRDIVPDVPCDGIFLMGASYTSDVAAATGLSLIAKGDQQLLLEASSILMAGYKFTPASAFKVR